MSLIQRNAENSQSVFFALLSIILGFSLLRSFGKGEFYIMDMDATVSALMIGAFIIIGIVLAVVGYGRPNLTRIPAVIVGIVALVFAVCLMLSIIDNNVHYAGWALAIYGVGCLIGGTVLPKYYS